MNNNYKPSRYVIYQEFIPKGYRLLWDGEPFDDGCFYFTHTIESSEYTFCYDSSLMHNITNWYPVSGYICIYYSKERVPAIRKVDTTPKGNKRK